MPENSSELFLRRAIELATANVHSGKGGPFGAVIVADGKIVAEAANSVLGTCDPTAHAEVNAIRAAAKALGRFSLAGCELYTSCEPCPMCLAAAHWAHVEAIHYAASASDAARAGFDDAYFYQQVALPPDQRKIPHHQALQQESWQSFAAWLDSPNRFEY